MQVPPKYTEDALLRKIQGTVVLELVVTKEGRPADVRVRRSLDPGGLDERAVAAVNDWRFEPGRLAGRPVDVLVTVYLDFTHPVEDCRADCYCGGNLLFSSQMNSISSPSAMMSCRCLTVHGFVYTFGSSTVMSISMRP